MKLSVKIDGIAAMQSALSDRSKQFEWATIVSLTRTAKEVQVATYAEMASKFDRPTPITMKSLRIRPATRQKIEAEVFLKSWEVGGKNLRSMEEMIGHQFRGGDRLRKRMEEAFTRAGLINSGEYLVPGPDAKLDQYGNLSRGQTQQIYAALRLFWDRYQNPTNSARSKRHAAAAGRMFWSAGPNSPAKRRRGVWSVYGQDTPKLILIVLPRVSYKRRINLPLIAQRVIDSRFKQIFNEEFSKAMASAR
jgi:cation transport regulator ChaB